MPRAPKRGQSDNATIPSSGSGAASPGSGTAAVYTMAEAAALKGVSYHTVSRAVRRRQLPARRLGRMALIAAEDLRAWQPMRERAPHKYRRRAPDATVGPAPVDLTMKDRVSLALELSTVIELMHEAAAERPLPEFMALLAERFASALGFDRVAVWGLDHSQAVARRLAAFGPPPRDLPEAAPLSELPAIQFGLALEQATAVPRSRFEREPSSGPPDQRGDLLLAPLRIGERTRGVLVADRGGAELCLTDNQLTLAQGLANQAALALDRARLLEAERERADHLAAVVENVSEAVFATDVSGRMSVVNAAGRSLLGLDDAPATADLIALVTKLQRRTVSGDPIPADEVPLARAARGEAVEGDCHLVITPAGEVKPVTVSARPMLGPGGEPQGAVAVVRDLSHERATAEREALRVTRLDPAGAGPVADIAPAADARTDLDQSLQAAIEQMTIALGGERGAIFVREEPPSLTPRAAFPPDTSWPAVELTTAPTVLIALTSRKPLFVTGGQASPSERWVLDQAQAKAILVTPLIAGEEAVGAALVGYDSDARHLSEDELRLAGALANQCAVSIEKARLMERFESAHRRLLAVVDHLPLAVLIVEAPTGRLVLANQAAADLVGGPLPAVVTGALGLTAADGTPFPEGKDPLALTLETGESRFGEPLGLRRADGSVARVLANHVPVRDAAGRVVSVVSVLQDVARLQALDQARDEFLSIAAHELRNPLTSLHGNLQLMVRRLRGDPARADDVRRLETILTQSERLAQLVSRLLDVSRAELGRLDLALAESDAAAVVRRTVEAARGLSSSHTLVVEGPSAAPVVWDEVRIEQVLANLVSNAIKHTPGGVVRVTLDVADDDWLRIAVRDSGPGIPPHVASNLFERYVRGRRRREGEATESSGLGLGLYISRLMARAHGGDLTASNPEDGGALFVLTVPRTARPAEPTAP